MAAPTITYGLTLIDIMNGGGNLYVAPTIESATAAGTYADNSSGTGWNTGSAITGLYGAEVALTTASSDFTAGKYIWLQCAYQEFGSPSNYDTLANGGVRVAFIDGSGNWARFNIGGSDLYAGSTAIGGWISFRNIGDTSASESGMIFTIDRTRTPDAVGGAIDWTDIDVMGSYINALSSDRMDIQTGRVNVADVPLMTGGDATTPASLDYFYEQRTSIPNDGDSNRFFTRPPEGFGGANGFPYVVIYGATFGDGVTPTYWRETGGQTAFSPSREAKELDATGIQGYGVAFQGDGTAGHGRINQYIQTSTCDHISLGHTWTGTDYALGEYDLTFTGHASATNHTSTNDLILHANEVIYTEWDIASAIFDDCESVSIDANTTLVSSIFRNTVSTSDGLVYTGVAANKAAITVEFKASNAGKDLTLGSGGAGTYTFSGLTVEAGHTLAIHNNSATNAITVEISAGITTSTTTAGGTISVTQPATSYTIQLPSIVNASRFQILNVNTAAELTNSTTSGGTGIDETYVKGTDYTAGDVGRYRVTYQSGTSANESIEGTFTFPATTATNSIPTAQVAQATYNTHGVDGSAVTGISWDSGNLQFDFNEVDDIIDGQDIGSWYYYFITTATGIDEAFGALFWPQVNKITNVTGNVDMTFDNVSADALQIINCWFEKDDGTTIISSTSNSIQIDPPAVFIVETGVSGLTSPESAQLFGTALEATIDTLVGTPAVSVSADIAAVKTVVDLGSTQVSVDAIPTAVENRQEMDANSTQLAAILTDTGTTIPADTAAIKAKTDSLTFTKAGEVDSNGKSVNGTTVTGSGTAVDPWGP